MQNYKIKVNDETESKEAQELFFELGYQKGGVGKGQYPKFIITAIEHENVWSSTSALYSAFEELTLPQLRDLVVLHRNDVRDATHTDKRKEQIYLTADKVIYYWQGEWCKSAINKSNNYENYIANSLTPIKKPEQGLISGADALRALADGKDVEFQTSSKIGFWRSVSETVFEYREILDEKSNKSDVDFKFRLKPRTIKLDGSYSKQDLLKIISDNFEE